MKLAPQHGSTVGYLALVVLLFSGVGVGVMLFVFQARGPVAAAEFMVAPPIAVGCPTGTGAPVCYRYDVTNVGGGADSMRCVVVPLGGAAATFTASESSTYQSPRPVEPDQTYPMLVEVDAGDEKEIEGAPSIGCGPAA